jgi:3-oxoacyl-[acyl-carrier protein] reductase
VQGEITTWLAESAKGTLQVHVLEIPALALTADIQVGFTLHEARSKAVAERKPAAASTGDKPVVLVTGARGGLGQAFADRLSNTYHVIGLSRSGATSSHETVESLTVDFDANDWETVLDEGLKGRSVYGIVHAAWPTGPQAGLLDADLDAVRAQVEFAGATTIRLARFLRAHSAGGGRMVTLGSTAGTLKPVLNMGPYSLGKATLEHTVRLLAPELARSGISINLVLPSFVPAGMNSAKTSRVVLAEAAKVPLGRVCSPEDVCRAVEFFLSTGTEFVTGQLLPLTGGQL